MPTYVYETTDDATPKRFEIRQSMNDPALTVDPETGRPVRRLITGGFGFMQRGGENPATPTMSGGHCCGGGACGCH